MTNQQHPITPPPELVQQWHESWYDLKVKHIGCDDHIAIHAARWGADEELEACCEYIAGPGRWFVTPQSRLAELRAARRPKPPSLAEQALEALGPVPLPETGGTDDCFLNAGAIYRHDTIRAALERLKELEKGNE